MGNILRKSVQDLNKANGGFQRTRLELTVGRILSERPVHASKARLWVITQSTDPLR